MAPLDARFGLPKNPIRIKPFERHGDGAVIQNHTAQAVRSGTVPELDTSKEYIWIVTKAGILVIGEEVVVGHETDSFAQKLGHPT